ncbi:NifB/NifX family molybdenum-iron cluster-binding protein [bacterium]|nr:NifB/NifX family molybdenum-iron cluster-binding protein [bacterium]
MKIAISTDSGHVSAHFGRCPIFTIVEITDGKVIQSDEIKNPGHHPGYLPQFLSEMDVEHIIAGGMGGRALELFQQYNIQPILGISGKIDEIISQLINGTLKGGESLCLPGQGKGYGLDKTACDHEETDQERI